ncbi:MAG: IS1380 family transposase [Firmicutes bacterium]|nr:IS1380 family transposase [Bacillota bacterium]
MLQEQFTTSHRKSASISEKFSLKHATVYGGANLLLDYYLGRLKLPELFLEHLAVHKAAWASYQMPDIATSLIAGFTLGLHRIHHFEELEDDELLALKLGLPKLPDYTILYKDLEKFDTPEKLASLGKVNQQILKYLLEREVILDIDSTVETAFGGQQMAGVGYNPKHHGRASYHPLLAFDGLSRSLIHARLRGGKAHTAEGFSDFYEECVCQLPSGVHIRFVRLDRGFRGEKVYLFLEDEAKVDYVAKLCWTSGLMERLSRGALWKRISCDEEIIEVCQLRAQLADWSKDRHVVIIRRRPADEPVQGTLFRDLLWNYEAIVTNLDWEPEDVWHFYNQRGAAENYIKEMKDGFGIDHFPTGNFMANWADLLLKMVAYNCFLAFQKELAAPGYKRFTVGRMRRLFFQVPAVLVRHSRRWTLRLLQSFRRQEAWSQMRASLAALNPGAT